MSTAPHHSTNPLDLLETDRPSPKPTNPIVGGGSPPTEPKPFGSVGGFSPQKPEPPDPTIISTTFSDIQRFSNKNWQISVMFLLFRRRSTWNPLDSATFKGFPTENDKYRWYFCFSDQDLLEIHQIRRDPTIFRRGLVQIRRIRPNIG